jgi:membrane fusion protein (multidrug efflux system)
MKRVALFAGFPLLVVLTALSFYLSGGRYISTENAYIRTGIAMISAGTSGQVMNVLVQENQQVQAGDLLFVLDLEPFDIAVDRATAILDDTRSEVALLKSVYLRQQVRLAAATEDKAYAQQELDRVEELAQYNTVSLEKLAARRHTLNVADNAVLAAEAEVATALAQLEGDPAQAIDEYPRVRRAQGELSQAKLERRRASVRAGISGTIAKLELHPGEFVTRGQPIFSLVQNDRVWIEANLKETQLTKLKIGQTASFEVDAYPGVTLASKVSSIAPASGAEFAILPAQNATGNWVKITQRVPVRMQVTSNQDLPDLRAGMSVSVAIDTGTSRSLKSLLRSLAAF